MPIPAWLSSVLSPAILAESVPDPATPQFAGFNYVNQAWINFSIPAQEIWCEGRINLGEAIYDGTIVRGVTDRFLATVTLTQAELFDLKDSAGKAIGLDFLKALDRALLDKFNALPPPQNPV